MSEATISRHELHQLIQTQLRSLLEQNNLEGAKLLLKPVQAPDIAQAIEELPEAMQAIAFRLLSKDEAIEVYEHLDSTVQQALIEDFKRQDVLDIVDKMSPDDRARLFEELPAKVVTRLLDQLSPAERQATAALLGYQPNTAGRLMTPEYISLKETWTIAEALNSIRSLAKVSETIYCLYVIDAERHLVGTLSLQDLVIAQPDQTVGEVMTRDVVYVQTDTDQEEAARVIQRYDFLAVPVVDREKRLVGILTVDDALDIVEEETTEDIYTLGGVQADKESYFQLNILSAAQKRVIWLVVLLFTNTFTSTIIAAQEEVLAQVVALAAFIPLLIDTGGNVGAQSSTVVIRGLSTDEITTRQSFWVISREGLAGILLGVMLGSIAFVWAVVLHRNLGVAIVVALSLLAISGISSITGAALPFLFKVMKLDPALMSAPFITTVVDVLGVLVYFLVARVVLQI